MPTCFDCFKTFKKHTIEEIQNMPAYKTWYDRIHRSNGLVGSGYASLDGMDVVDIFRFGPNPGLVRLNLQLRDEIGSLPGAVFLRGPSVGLFIITNIMDVPHVVLVRQPRAPVGEFTDEIPAGMLDDSASFKNQALQEALEETGINFAPQDLLTLGSPIYMSPGGSDETIQLYFARCAKFVQPKHKLGTEDERIQVKCVPLRDALQSNKDGKFWLAYGRACAGGHLVQ